MAIRRIPLPEPPPNMPFWRNQHDVVRRKLLRRQDEIARLRAENISIRRLGR